MKQLSTAGLLGALAAGLALGLSISDARAGKDDDTLRIAWGVDGVMVNADNYFGATRSGIWFTKMVWDTLVERDPTSGTYLPNLALSWAWTDPTTFEIKLRPGVKF